MKPSGSCTDMRGEYHGRKRAARCYQHSKVISPKLDIPQIQPCPTVPSAIHRVQGMTFCLVHTTVISFWHLVGSQQKDYWISEQTSIPQEISDLVVRLWGRKWKTLFLQVWDEGGALPLTPLWPLNYVRLQIRRQEGRHCFILVFKAILSRIELFRWQSLTKLP